MAFFNLIIARWHVFLAATVLALHALASMFVPTPALAPAQFATSTLLAVHATSTLKVAAPAAVPTVPQAAPARLTPVAAATTTPAAPAAAQTATSTEVAPALSPEQVNDNTRASLVNILCTTKAGGDFEPISGSGVIVDTRGVILTNAHVGQYFLLRDYGEPDNVDCIVRTGSPAQAMYTAELIYLPPEWIEANASQIGSSHATGTGENDYSFLFITGSTNPSVPLPANFPALSMTSDAPNVGDQVLLAAYPAGFLDGQTIQMNLYLTSAITTVQALYTFDDPHNVDDIAVGGTVVSQSGSSGGAVVRLSDGELEGLISTDTSGTTTAIRQLNAITLAHINRSLESEGQGGIATLLNQNLQQTAANFQANIAPQETQELEAVLNKQ